jgi:hypothetical protein
MLKDDFTPIIAQFTVAARVTAGEYFGYFIVRATGFLVFVRVVTFHTASGNPPHSSIVGEAAGQRRQQAFAVRSRARPYCFRAIT